MRTDALEAWLLSKIPSGDTSLRLHLFTRQKGVITCFYKGGRTPKKQAVLQSFVPLWLSLDTQKESHFARTVEAGAIPLSLTGHSLFSALYVNELVFYALKPFDSHPEVYDAYQYVLHGLTIAIERVAIESLLRRFEWVLLKTCGYRLAFAEGVLVSPDAFYHFDVGQGFVMAKDGIPADTASAIVEGNFQNVLVLKSAKHIMRQAIDCLLVGRELKSRRLFGVLQSS
jgi:DNA repair protein RecO (recombination protein O)